MRITAKKFALSLYESAAGKPASQVKLIVKKFVELLAKKNKLALEARIIMEFEKIWNEENGLLEAEITSASDLDKTMIKLLQGYIAQLSDAKKVIIEERIDKNILGGVIIKYGDKVLDGSLKNSLEELKSKMIK
ncbi:ATP synthase F1 subunit delta [Candidatus Falkowbacteria bacterium RIFCSPLOWO2_12_FULL_45_13]|uniref:ATP synthase subunit delta n=2 Tax=Candidatus Falkowiibacteriota TaxID=1752728 RepID=A0A1F5SBI1_9BACT|nr:MAG: ATP synthase F1 subunit delta [Candidatus Falkowbacteria bacterium RIFCSPLOWO2_02_FULL_45_21]OGF32156.1 MAG: ATP synthase F1 subunit delta [Candidatus Falkowbacteria bacterium RIFCSPLOWO2_12_FULL_45_13]